MFSNLLFSRFSNLLFSRFSNSLVSRLLACIVLGQVLLSGGMAGAQDKTDTGSSEEQKKRWLAFYSEEAADYRFLLQGGDEQELKFMAEPIFTFTNPVRRGEQHGAAYVWTKSGRPEVFGAIWSSVRIEDRNQRNVCHEFISLSALPVISKHAPQVGRRGPVPGWTAGEAGIRMKPIPDAPKPSKVASLRLTQMRRLAREFKATIRPDKVEQQDSLRLLAQPLYRYSADDNDILDGAIFTFVMGTDPELILLIEAVKAGDKYQWQFAAARFTNQPMQLDYKRAKVWECDFAKPYVGDQPYFLYWGVSVRDSIMK